MSAQIRNTILNGDCISLMKSLPDGCVDLAFADPPFNIGYDYDVYDDRRSFEDYMAFSRDWMGQVHRILKPSGSFWLAIGDDFAAELKVLANREIGFHMRSWVIWYYTFGVNCKAKFSRSHTHLFYFVKDRSQFTFRGDELENRIPSARQLVYNDKRANPTGRLPDDTWIIPPVGNSEAPGRPDVPETWTLRPQDVEQCFSTTEDTWYFPRVAGTFKERAGFHGCQMPEQLLGRIIRLCSDEGELVFDPFAGSASTLVVAKKLGRDYLGTELSADYHGKGIERLAATKVGQILDGAAEPNMSAPKTPTGRSQKKSAAKSKR
ncbi:DNA-methyltransferase [Lacunimicrobium album]